MCIRDRSNRSMLEITNLPKLKSFWSIDEVENSIVVANSVLKFFKSVEKVMTHDAKLITFELSLIHISIEIVGLYKER